MTTTEMLGWSPSPTRRHPQPVMCEVPWCTSTKDVHRPADHPAAMCLSCRILFGPIDQLPMELQPDGGLL